MNFFPDPAKNETNDHASVWLEFDRQRARFWSLAEMEAKMSDVDLARSPEYNAFLQYGVATSLLGGPEACRIIGLALTQGHPDTTLAYKALGRLWAGLIGEVPKLASGSVH